MLGEGVVALVGVMEGKGVVHLLVEALEEGMVQIMMSSKTLEGTKLTMDREDGSGTRSLVTSTLKFVTK